MDDKKTLSVSILGKTYSLVTDENQTLIKSAAQHVEMLMRQVVPPTISPAEAAKKTTFVALQVAVELLKTRAELAEMSGRLTELNSLIKELG